jgi:excisionase family DNA binding protein
MTTVREMNAHAKALLSTQETADLLNVRRQTVTRLVRLGRLKSVKKSERLILVDRDSAIEYLHKHRCPGYGAPRKQA